MDLTTILPYPLLLDIYRALIEPDITVNNFFPVFALASTCKALYQVLHESRSIWYSLFSAKYDLHEHHQVFGYDLKQELRIRHIALKTTQKGPTGSQLAISSSAECQCHQEPDSVFSVLVRIALENVQNNIKSLIHYRAHWHYSAFQLSYFTLRSSIISRWKTPACQLCSDWLAFCEVMGLANVATFKMILRQRSIETVDWLFASFTANRSVSLIAQVVHLKMIYLVAHRDRNKDIPMPQYYTTEPMLGSAKRGCFAPSIYLPQALMNLEGHWVGYTSDDTEDSLRIFLQVTKPTSDNEILLAATENSRTTSGLVKQNGEIDFTGVTSQDLDHQYSGFLLPWGIVGVVTRPGFSQPKKLFWIWKDGQ